MDKYEIEQYMKEKEKFTIPEIQQKFHLEYGEVRRYFYDLESTEQIILKDGQFYYNFDNEISELYQTLLWECVKDRKYNKFKLKGEYKLNAEDISDFEDWLLIEDYYDFVTDEVLITKEEFIKRFGKREESKMEESPDEDFIKELERLASDTKNLDEDEDDEEELEDYTVNIMSTVKDDDTTSKTCDAMLRQLLEGHSIQTKEDFLSLAEHRLTIEEKEMPIFLDILDSVIEDVKKMTEIEFKAFLVKLLKD